MVWCIGPLLVQMTGLGISAKLADLWTVQFYVYVHVLHHVSATFRE